MDKHHGQVVEYRVRKNAYCISDLARASNVNRRSIYNWFNQKRLKEEIIFKIGLTIRHDFSQEFPEFFKTDDFKAIHQVQDTDSRHFTVFDQNLHDSWKDKYLRLLETYNNLILKELNYL